MKVLNRLTIKHLFMNKKRTIVTIIGIILSTALMVGIGLLLSTFLYSMQQDAIQFSGSHHAYFDNITKEEKNTLELNINFNKTYSYGVVGYGNIKSENTYKPYLYIVSGDNEILKTETLLEGRLPENNREIVLPNHLKNNGQVDYKIGDEITFDIGPRVIEDEETYNNNIALATTTYEYQNKNITDIVKESIRKKETKTYTVVGIIKRSIKEDYSSPGYMAYTINEENVAFYRTYGEYKNVKKSYELTKEVCSNLSNPSCNVNDSLLYYYGVSRYSNVNRTIISSMTIALTLLSIGCIIVIYNSFAISTMERKKSFGLYSSIGATPKQIKYTVFFEAFIVGGIGIILGILSSFLGIYVTIQVLNHLVKDSWGMTLKFVVEPLYIIIPILFMILVVYLSAFIPAKRSEKVSSIEMIRENDEIKIPNKKVKTPKWIRKIFKMEGEIALKNMKRNKRKYRITLLAIIISIVLFISFSTYLTLGIRITDVEDAYAYDIGITTDDAKAIEEIIKKEEVEKYYKVKQKVIEMKMEEQSIYQKNFYEYYKNIYDTTENTLMSTIVILEDKDFKELSKNISKENTPIFMNQLKYTFYQNDTRKSYQTKIFEKEINHLTLCGHDKGECEQQEVVLLNENVDFFKYLLIDSNLPIIFVSRSMTEQNSILSDESKMEFVTILSKDYEKLYEDIDKKYGSQNGFNAYAPKIELESQKNSLLAIKILLYGFITLVTLIGVTSVFNTIHTSIHLRRKEFAMLRSIGLSPKGFNKMIFFESLFFGLKSLIFALPISFFFIYLINLSIGDTFSFGSIVVPWNAIIIAMVGVFLIVLLTMWYSVSKIKKENILNSLRDENI